MMEFTIFEKYYAPNSGGRMNWCAAELEDTGFFTIPRDFPVKKFGEWFSNEESAILEALTIFTKHSQSFDSRVFEHLKDLRAFKRLRFLSIPFDAIPFVDMDSISEQIEYLQLNCSRSLTTFEYWKAGKRPLMFEQKMPKLEWLSSYCAPIYFQNFDVEKYPSLKALCVQLEDHDKTGKSLKIFHEHPHIKGFSIDSVKNKDLLKGIRRDIEWLSMWNLSPKEFNFSYLEEFKNLRFLRINGANSIFDMRHIKNLGYLTEIELIQFKGIINVESLLDLSRLEKIHIHSENKNDISDMVKQKILKAFKHCPIVTIGSPIKSAHGNGS